MTLTAVHLLASLVIPVLPSCSSRAEPSPTRSGDGEAKTQAADFDHEHGRWSELLGEFVHEGSLVDYRGLLLLDRAYVPETLDETLRKQARAFLADPEKNDQRIEDGELAVSKIFDWSEGELEQYEPDGIVGLLRDLGPESVAEDPALEDVELKYRDYDWSLNESDGK